MTTQEIHVWCDYCDGDKWAVSVFDNVDDSDVTLAIFTKRSEAARYAIMRSDKTGLPVFDYDERGNKEKVYPLIQERNPSQ